jgi:hypothetical protein
MIVQKDHRSRGIRLGTPRCTGENIGCIPEHLEPLAKCRGTAVTCLGVAVTSLRAMVTSLGAAVTSLRVAVTRLGAPATCVRSPRITVEQSRKIILFVNTAGAPGNHSDYLSFNDY